MIWKWIKRLLAGYGPAEGFFADDRHALQPSPASQCEWDSDGIMGVDRDGAPCAISWKDLRSVSVISTGERFGEEYFYAFEAADGRSCQIPSSVDFHRHLPGWLKKLPGFKEETFARAWKCTNPATFYCWNDPQNGFVHEPPLEPPPESPKFRWDKDGIAGADQNGTTLNIAWNDLARVTVVTTDQGPAACDVFFVFEDSKGQSCVIPQEADSDGSLLGQLQSLSGFDNRAFVEGMKSVESASFLCWLKSGR